MQASRDSRDHRRGWTIWGFAVGLYFVAVFHRMSLGVAGTDAQSQLHVDHGALATFTALQFAVYLAMQVPAGLAADRIGPRRTLAVGMALIAAGELAFAFSTSLGAGLAARALVGAGDALTLLNVLRLAAVWLPAKHRPLAAVLTGAAGAVGQLVGTVPLQVALDQLGWAGTFGVAGGATLILVPAALAVIRDRPAPGEGPADGVGPAGGAPAEPRAAGHPALAGGSPDADAGDGAANPPHDTVLRTIRDAWNRPGTRHAYWVHMALFGPFLVVGALWGVPYLQQGQHLSRGTAGTFVLLLSVGFAVAGPVVGSVAGRSLRAQDRTLAGLGVMTVVVWAVVLLWPGGLVPPAVLAVAFVLTGVGAAGGMVGFDVVRRANPERAAASASALVNFGGFGAAIVSLLLVSLLLGAGGDGGDPSTATWQHALLPMLAITTLAVVHLLRHGRRRGREGG